AADLNGKPIVLRITDAPQETLKNKNGEEVKTVLYFKGTKKTLPLNRTNWDSVVDITGEDDSINWQGHKVEAYPTTTQFGALYFTHPRALPPQLRPARGYRAAPSGVCRHDESGHVPEGRNRQSAVLAGQDRHHRHRRPDHRSRPALCRGRQALPRRR